MNTKTKKGIINASLFIFFVGITFYIIFKDNNIVEILNIVKKIDIKYILVAILCMTCFVFSEGINIYRTLKLSNCKTTIIQCIKYALVGFFFSSVTPSASGGDPMQIYYMKKDKLPIGQSALAVLTEFSSFQFVTIIMAIIGFITNYNFIGESIGNIKYLLIIGVLINSLILIALLLNIFSNKIILKILNLICKLLNKMHYKKTEKFKDKSLKQIKEYKKGTRLLKKNKKVLVKIILTTIIQITLYHSIPYFIYLSFGLTGVNYFTFLALQAVLYISVSSIPLPGSVGVSEGGFMIIYNLLFPEKLLSSAMLLSRGISFYLFVIISGLAILIFEVFSNHTQKHLKN